MQHFGPWRNGSASDFGSECISSILVGPTTKCKCKVCKERWHYSSSISPMLIDSFYKKVLNYYKLNNTRNTFICYKCMEKALGRKLKESDLVDKKYPFNDEFREWYIFKK